MCRRVGLGALGFEGRWGRTGRGWSSFCVGQQCQAGFALSAYDAIKRKSAGSCDEVNNVFCVNDIINVKYG